MLPRLKVQLHHTKGIRIVCTLGDIRIALQMDIHTTEIQSTTHNRSTLNVHTNHVTFRAIMLYKTSFATPIKRKCEHENLVDYAIANDAMYIWFRMCGFGL